MTTEDRAQVSAAVTGTLRLAGRRPVREPGGVAVATPPRHTGTPRVRGVAVYETPRARPDRGSAPPREETHLWLLRPRTSGRGAASEQTTCKAGRGERTMQRCIAPRARPGTWRGTDGKLRRSELGPALRIVLLGNPGRCTVPGLARRGIGGDRIALRPAPSKASDTPLRVPPAKQAWPPTPSRPGALLTADDFENWTERESCDTWDGKLRQELLRLCGGGPD